MNIETPQPESAAGTVPPAPEPAPKRLVNPNLSGTLVADHAALQNDLLQAQELAGDFQRQLAGKSNEYAQLKQILEKTQADLAHLQSGIMELRAERHQLANEAMRATAFQAKLAKVTSERDRLRVDLEVMRDALTRKDAEFDTQFHARDKHIAEMVIELVNMKQALEEARSRAAAAAAATAAGQPEPSIEVTRAEPAMRSGPRMFSTR